MRCLGGLLPPEAPPTGITLAPLTSRSRLLTITGRALTNGLFHLVATGQSIGTSPVMVRTKPASRFPPA